MAIVDELRDAALRMERGAFLQEPELLLSAAAGIDTLRAQVAELEKRVAAKSQEVVDVLNNAERYYDDFRARIAELEREKGGLRAEKHGAYAERNLLVAALSKMFPSHMERTTIEGWDPEWEQCVYITLPTGQVSWHLKAGEEMNFQHLAWSVVPRWDGHDTPEKYRRLAALKPTT